MNLNGCRSHHLDNMHTKNRECNLQFFSTTHKRISHGITYDISSILYSYISHNISNIMVCFMAICPFNFCMSVYMCLDALACVDTCGIQRLMSGHLPQSFWTLFVMRDFPPPSELESHYFVPEFFLPLIPRITDMCGMPDIYMGVGDPKAGYHIP